MAESLIEVVHQVVSLFGPPMLTVKDVGTVEGDGDVEVESGKFCRYKCGADYRSYCHRVTTGEHVEVSSGRPTSRRVFSGSWGLVPFPRHYICIFSGGKALPFVSHESQGRTSPLVSDPTSALNKYISDTSRR